MRKIVLQKSTKWVLTGIIAVAGLTVADRELAVSSALREGVGIISKAVDPRQLLCLAENLFREAGGESQLGQAAVARVVMNRINAGFGRTPCAVVHQKYTITDVKTGEDRILCQFSWTCTENKPINPRDPRYQQARAVAYDVLAYDSYKNVVPSSTLFFHADTVDPQWSYQKVATIGNHHFYSKNKNKRDSDGQQSSKRP